MEIFGKPETVCAKCKHHKKHYQTIRHYEPHCLSDGMDILDWDEQRYIGEECKSSDNWMYDTVTGEPVKNPAKINDGKCIGFEEKE